MRAKEFVNEGKRGKITKRQGMSSVGIDLFRDPEGYDRTYELNRMMMAVACADGTGIPIDINKESWVGKDNSAQPYTKLEQDMMKQAAKSIGSKLHDVVRGDLKSQELPDTQKSSPIQAFKGFGK